MHTFVRRSASAFSAALLHSRIPSLSSTCVRGLSIFALFCCPDFITSLFAQEYVAALERAQVKVQYVGLDSNHWSVLDSESLLHALRLELVSRCWVADDKRSWWKKWGSSLNAGADPDIRNCVTPCAFATYMCPCARCVIIKESLNGVRHRWTNWTSLNIWIVHPHTCTFFLFPCT